jgi:anaerobic ribonucleoside-triphosphate reductase
MEGIWCKQCPRCGNYLKKTDPQEAGMCCACGWEEYVPAFFCEIVNRYCSMITETNAKGIPRAAFHHLPLAG